jgi:hypothetical protein
VLNELHFFEFLDVMACHAQGDPELVTHFLRADSAFQVEDQRLDSLGTSQQLTEFLAQIDLRGLGYHLATPFLLIAV